MPGIAGFTIASNLGKNSQEILIDMQELITHQEFYIKDELFCDNNVCATRSHTNIIQKQPQPYYESGMYVWLDGDFYDQARLDEQKLFERKSDPATLLALFKQNNDFSFLRKINGVYSAVIYNVHENKVHLITDRYGLRHLYWTTHKGCLVWGSEVKVMLAIPGFEPKIDFQAVRDFFDIGYLLEDRTWFEGVELLSSGTVLTWDIKQRSFQKERYWWWDEIKPLTGNFDENEIAEELGRLFVNAVKLRCSEDERVGMALSGGLDSRALLAAMPDRSDPIHTFTYGQEGCDDIRIAAMAAKKKGAVHHTLNINSDNWMKKRLNCVWWTDGQLNLLHMHDTAAYLNMREYYLINMDGFLGDAVLGGSYLEDERFSYFKKINNRGRRFIYEGVKSGNIYIHQSLPFFDLDLIEFAVSIPQFMQRRSRIYIKMLLKFFPDFFKTIPWQKTGFPISSPAILIEMTNLSRRVQYKLPAIFRNFLDRGSINNYVDYPSWLRQEPARSFLESVLYNPQALYPQYIEKSQVQRRLEMHLGREKDWSEYLGLVLTFEIWLQQVFESKYRAE